MLSMLELRTLSQRQPNISPQSGRARTRLGTEEPKTPFISMAAQTGAGPGPGMGPGPGEERKEPIFPVLAVAGLPAPGQRKACIWSAAGTGARPEGGEGADWDKGPKQEGESKTGREGSQGSRGSAQNKAEKGKKVTACKGKTGRGRIRQGVGSPTMSLEGRRNHR